MKRSIFILVAAIALTSCSATIARKDVRQAQASFSSTGQDSGILKDSAPAKGGFLVNEDWISGYDSLLDKYGKTLSPPRVKGDRDGIVQEDRTGTIASRIYRVSDAAMERALVMNQRRVNEAGP